MNEPVLISLSRQDDGTYLVIDALDRRHFATDEQALGKLLASLAVDSELPRLRVEKRNDLVGIVASVFRRIAPQFRELVDVAEPVAHHVTTRAMAYDRKRKAARAQRGDE